MAPCSGPKETANKKYIQTIIFFRISFLNRSSGVHYSDGLSSVTNVFSIVKHVRNDCNKMRIPRKAHFFTFVWNKPQAGDTWRVTLWDFDHRPGICKLCHMSSYDETRLWQQCTLKVYSYFEKGCRKKCPRQSRKVLWVVFSSLFFKEISNNGKRGHGRMFPSA